MKQIFLILILIATSFSSLSANSVEEEVLEAANSMKKLLRSEKGIPQKIIKSSQAIVVIPSSLKVSFFLGGKYGEGVASIRKSDGSWSYPFFVDMSGGSLGFQVGVESSDTIFVFRTANSVNELLSDKFTLGAGASVSAGPMNANVEKNSEVNMSAEIFSYSQSKGLFVGASFEGAIISNNNEKNRALYGNDVTVDKIVTADSLNSTYSVREFLNNINSFTK